MTIQGFSDYGQLGQDIEFGYLNSLTPSSKRSNPRLVVNDKTLTMLQAIKSELKKCNSFSFSVAFVSPSGIALLKQALIEFEGVGEIITSTYLGFNSPRAFAELHALKKLGIDVRIHTSEKYHPKGYIFNRPDEITAILGSSNLTETALVTNHEWNIKISASNGSDIADQLRNLVDSEVGNSAPLTEDWIESYASVWEPPKKQSTPVIHFPKTDAEEKSLFPSPTKHREKITPNVMQVAALNSIKVLRDSGEQRALVISATGTGKTMLAALDVRDVNPDRVLFIAHREQIIDRSIKEFKRVLERPSKDFGKLVGFSREVDRKYVFSTIQTLSRPEILQGIHPDSFDYILIDEVHRATAETYKRVIDYFRPKFMLGMTATPERTDGASVFELFNFNVPYEIRLGEALEQDMLSPFHYYGVTDIVFEDGTTTSDATELKYLVANERVDHLIKNIDIYSQAGVAPRGLIFCSRKEEAHKLSEEMNQKYLRGKLLRTVALTGEDSILDRQEQVRRLENGELDYIFTVDIFNEGVDIPSINQIIMLRQTQSAIIFVQQLGRGLRKFPDKDHVVVIDFIGNYSNNYMIPIALFGDDSLNKESLRQELIAAEERGVISGLSSVQFDRISRENVLRSIQSSKLDSYPNLKNSIETIRNRLGRMPQLQDFLKFESVDPIILANRDKCYPLLLKRLFKVEHGLSENELKYLQIISSEIMQAKRLHESALLKELLTRESMTVAEVEELLDSIGLPSATFRERSVINSLTLEFNVEGELSKFGNARIAFKIGDSVSLTPDFIKSYKSSHKFKTEVDDLLVTTQRLIVDRYDLHKPFTPGKQYSRKDASRLLNWTTNMSSTIYGYKVDKETETCPIFASLNKSETISSSTAYINKVLDPHTMMWHTRSKRTLKSEEVRTIVANEVSLPVFVKKDDSDGPGHYYLGDAFCEEAEDSFMPSGEKLPVVKTILKFSKPVDPNVFSYFHQDLTE
ncbi:MAG: DEAD/DEAH box helicase [Microbacteriaceae bacterium]|nr:DEAD/DEAH box helicase [Microbacteriaceae bacterium]